MIPLLAIGWRFAPNHIPFCWKRVVRQMSRRRCVGRGEEGPGLAWESAASHSRRRGTTWRIRRRPTRPDTANKSWDTECPWRGDARNTRFAVRRIYAYTIFHLYAFLKHAFWIPVSPAFRCPLQIGCLSETIPITQAPHPEHTLGSWGVETGAGEVENNRTFSGASSCQRGTGVTR